MSTPENKMVDHAKFERRQEDEQSGYWGKLYWVVVAVLIPLLCVIYWQIYQNSKLLP